MASHIPINNYSLEPWHNELISKCHYWVEKLRHSPNSYNKIMVLNRSITLLSKDYNTKPEVKKIFNYRSNINKKLTKDELWLKVKDCGIEIHVLDNNTIDNIYIVA
tara:strand:- start:61 stop:378 length:318 start_codon:yes stop_codon:yes gene_type:complete